MKKAFVLIMLITVSLPVFAQDVKDVIAGKSFQHEGAGSSGAIYINSFDEDCKNVTLYVDGVKKKTLPVTCGKTAEFDNGNKIITYSIEDGKVKMSVNLGMNDRTYYPKEVPNP